MKSRLSRLSQPSLYIRACKRLADRLIAGKISTTEYFDKLLAISVHWKRKALAKVLNK